MPTQDRAYTYGVAATLEVASNVAATAQASAAASLATIATALAALAESVELSFPKDGSGNVEVSPAGSAAYAVEGLLMIGSDESEGAQAVAKDAAAAIATAVAGTNPAVTVTLDNENGRYVVQQLG